MADRFFPVTLLGGRLHPRDIPHFGKWDSRRLERRTEAEIMLFPGDTIIRTKKELEAALREPDDVTPARTLWIHEDLEDEIHHRWESNC